MERYIKVEYNGKSCGGRLVIEVNFKEIYNEKYRCESTGCVWFDDDGDEHVTSGELLWEDADKFDKDIQLAVEKELSKIRVCCGDCV
jgi:hypothetical protein